MTHTTAFLPATAFVRRRADDYALGFISLSGPQDIQAHRQLPTGAVWKNFTSADAALAWVRASPQTPNLRAYDSLGHVYGPILADWGGFILMGHVWSQEHAIASRMRQGKTPIADTFVVQDDQNRIRARMRFQGGSWRMLIEPRNGAVVTCLQRRHLPDALRLLCMELLSSRADIHGHARMAMIQGTTDIVLRAEAFLQRLDGWRHALLTPAPEGTEAVVPPRCVFNQLVLRRGATTQLLGNITCMTKSGYRAETHVIKLGRAAVGDWKSFVSLDAAIHWLDRPPSISPVRR